MSKEQKETSHNHYVPVTYMERFATKNDKGKFIIGRLSKNANNNSEIIELPTTAVCQEKHIYTLPNGATKEERQFVEDFYNQQFEKHYTSIYNILTNENKVDITDDERRLVISTVVTMLLRTRKLAEMHHDLINRTVPMLFEMAKAVGKDYYIWTVDGKPDKKVSIAGETIEEHQKRLRKEDTPMIALTQLQFALKLIELRKDRDSICIYKLRTNQEYITSDNPVEYGLPTGENSAAFDRDNFLYLPLDTKHMLCLIPNQEKQADNIRLRIFRNVYHPDFERIRAVIANVRTFINSNKNVLGTVNGLTTALAAKLADDETRPKRATAEGENEEE